MVLRVRFASGRRAPRRGGASLRFVVAACALLQPAAIAGWCLAGWRLGGDVGWTSRFPINSGPLSHWQGWIAIAFTIQFAAYLLQCLIPLPKAEDSARGPQRQAGMAGSSSFR